jgi:hypothetical protein
MEVVEDANIAPVVVTVCCLGAAGFEKLRGGSLRLSSQQKVSRSIVARAPEANSQNERYGMVMSTWQAFANQAGPAT